MSVTGDLRAMLDERDVKYMVDDYSDYEVTEWNGPYNLWWRFTYNPYDDVPYGEVQLLDTGGATHLTPAQAIAATLGVGVCEADETDLIPFVRANGDVSEVDYIRVMECSSCGGTFEHVNGSYEFCPRCGRRIEVDE